MNTNDEIAIPKSGTEVVLQTVMTVIVIVFLCLAVLNIIDGVALIASCLWIAIVGWIVRDGMKNDDIRSIRIYLINLLGDLVGNHFAAVSYLDTDSREIIFGFRLFRHRFINKHILIDKIETVEWTAGQATGMAGRDMNDWRVCVWFDHGDPEKSEKQRKWHRKPDQDIYIVGPSTPRVKTEALGLALISLLRSTGAALVPTDKPTCFVRHVPEITEKQSIQLCAAAGAAESAPAER